MNTLQTLIVIILATNYCFAQQMSSFIHVDQFGYLTDAEKVAVITNPQIGYNASESYNVGTSVEVRDLYTNAVVFSATPTLWNNGNTHSQSGDQGWWFDFSTVDTQGTYYIYDPSTGHQSGAFEINENPYKNVIKAAFKAFYYNRCNAPKLSPYAQPNWVDADNFPQDFNVRNAFDPNNSLTERDMSGGWFDAGDYNKYVTFAHDPVHQLLSAYQEHSILFTDDWNIPESNDGIPDILNEIRWELDWLKKMINADGSVHIKMGSIDYADNDFAPPSNNMDARYYAPTCSSAALSVASMFAHASLVYSNFTQYSSYVSMLENEAILCWDYFLPFFNNSNLQTNCDDQTVKAGDADWDINTQTNHAVVAAIYLYALTGNVTYSNFVANNINNVELIANNFISPQHAVILEALLYYTTLQGANVTAVNTILTVASDAITNDWGEYYEFSNTDLYRAHSPDWVYYWGSNMTKANIGNLCHVMVKYNVQPTANTALLRKASELIHYFHGVNPQGLVYLSNMYQHGADRSANQIYHTWFNDGTDWDDAITSLYGPAPGFLAGGPNQAYTGSFTPPANQPLQKCYLDYNDGFPDVAWEITEPAIYYQAAYVRFLANYVDTSNTTITANIGVINNCIEVYPNPTNNYFKIEGNLNNYTIQILDSNGNLFQTVNPIGSVAIIDISELPNGLFFIRVEDENNTLLSIEKILKVN